MQQEEPQAISPAGVTQKPTSPKGIAPVWHTLLIVALILANSFGGASQARRLSPGGARIFVYAGTLITELILFTLVWLGIRKRSSVRELIGGHWKSVEDFLIDFAIAIGFLVASALLLAGLRIALGTLDLHHLDKQLDATKKMLAPLIPNSKLDAGLFVVLSVFAGFFEEIIFRGYLQRQIGSLAGNAWMGIGVSAIIFGAAHGYQGARMMIVIAVFGAFFGLLAHFRKSLRPGIMAHAIQDAFSGIALYLLTHR